MRRVQLTKEAAKLVRDFNEVARVAEEMRDRRPPSLEDEERDERMALLDDDDQPPRRFLFTLAYDGLPQFLPPMLPVVCCMLHVACCSGAVAQLPYQASSAAAAREKAQALAAAYDPAIEEQIAWETQQAKDRKQHFKKIEGDMRTVQGAASSCALVFADWWFALVRRDVQGPAGNRAATGQGHR